MTPDDPKAIIRDLLKIVKVAMPDDLYALDIRVARAEAYLEQRPPSSGTVLGMPGLMYQTHQASGGRE